MAIDPWPEHRYDQRGHADFERADQRKRAARYVQLLGDGFKKYAQRAGKREGTGDVDENPDCNDIPAIEEAAGGRILCSCWCVGHGLWVNSTRSLSSSDCVKTIRSTRSG